MRVVPRQEWSDPGLQPERTQLAWQRTAIGVVIGCAVLALTVVREGHPYLGALAGVLGGFTAWWALVVASRRRISVQHPPWVPLLVASGVVAVLGLLGVVAAVERLAG
ncbi:DUF202 domain-containing protein [Luteimicrobium subarcticum]|uniref:Uncharacterized protein DUF202 n=1 Tax=Luteimicrobium subarcticum TaxID=620910 RepID=A0A2M8WUK4_9MICO|nr:DUF202 domain-containing protein [Luteimicrobium subarcticum]PJI94588.1 uncharacterized protein DUF202 [Luteimicrobium subarcticum]